MELGRPSIRILLLTVTGDSQMVAHDLAIMVLLALGTIYTMPALFVLMSMAIQITPHIQHANLTAMISGPAIIETG